MIFILLTLGQIHCFLLQLQMASYFSSLQQMTQIYSIWLVILGLFLQLEASLRQLTRSGFLVAEREMSPTQGLYISLTDFQKQYNPIRLS